MWRDETMGIDDRSNLAFGGARGGTPSMIDKLADRLAAKRPEDGKLTAPGVKAYSRPANAAGLHPLMPQSAIRTARSTLAPDQAAANERAFARSRSRFAKHHIKLDFDDLRERGYVVPGEETIIAEEFRLIKRPLLQSQTESSGLKRATDQIVMVTSAQPQEGKSFTSINLALSMASEHNKSVLLVDADLLAPSVHRLLGFEATRGLADVLLDDSINVSDVLVGTDIENLNILPAGRSLPSSNELFASARMANFVRQLAEDDPERVLIFDSPPLLARSETSVLAQHMQQIVFVIEAERTPQTAIQSALEMLNGHENVGLVLNKVKPQLGGRQFGNYYGYYGYNGQYAR